MPDDANILEQSSSGTLLPHHLTYQRHVDLTVLETVLPY